jgi:formylglycine-generating enzyme required for sulfatase activity
VTCEEKSCLVEGGAFYRGEDKNYPATVSSFHLDRYEVTVGRMRAFVAAYNNWRLENPKLGAGAHPANPGTGWQSDWDKYLPATAEALREGLDCSISYSTWRDAIGTAEQESYPINCVNWYEAFAFCIWDKGGRLPTEAEWEYAAAGGSDERLYPWGNDGKDPPANCEDTDYRPDSAVGKYPDGAGRWGQLDLGGSMFEWVFDWYASPYTKPCDDCANTTATSQRVIRGGSWDFDATYLPAAKRRGNLPEERSSSIGVRCARPVPPE